MFFRVLFYDLNFYDHCLWYLGIYESVKLVILEPAVPIIFNYDISKFTVDKC